ncbi:MULTISPECIES: trypsin-like serine peptidase [Streptomyces]|uniref:Trypsin-like serine peptidase n=1 Tax=Streptomyces ramulosus TaxID=47762 RepID=A0ABW1FRF2_9ACTN
MRDTHARTGAPSVTHAPVRTSAPRRRAVVRRAAVASAVACALTAAFAPGVVAAPAPGGAPAEGKVLTHAAAATAKDEQQVRAYWTPERIAALNTQVKDVPPRSGKDGAPWEGATATTVGRLFFTDHGEDASCTATAVKSANGSTVVTAGHCLNATDLIGENNQWQTHVLYVPGYHDGKAPLGTFVVRWSVVNSVWLENDQIHARFDAHDQAFAVVGRNERGQTLQQATGAAQAIAYDAPGDRAAVQFGYPRAASDPAREGLPEYTGRELAYCQGTPWQYPGTPDHTEPAGMWGAACVMGGGASGGPRLGGFSAATGRGEVVGVNTQSAFMDAAGKVCQESAGSGCVRHLVGPQFTTALTKPLHDRAEQLN